MGERNSSLSERRVGATSRPPPRAPDTLRTSIISTASARAATAATEASLADRLSTSSKLARRSQFGIPREPAKFADNDLASNSFLHRGAGFGGDRSRSGQTREERKMNMNDAHLPRESGQEEQPSEAAKTKGAVSRRSLADSIKRYSEVILTIIPAIVGAIVAFYVLISTESGTSIRKEFIQLDVQFNDLKLAVTKQMANQDELIRKIQKIENTISSLSNIPKDDVLYLQTQQLANGVSELKSREDKIEAVILNNPSKALEMPLIERDVENIKTAEQTNFASMKDSVDRIYDLNKWLLDYMFA